MKTWIAVLCAMLVATTVAAQGSYEVKPGDVLNVEVLEDPQLNRQVLVLPDGQISFPFAGTLRAGGRTLGQIEDALTGALAPNFAIEPNIFVSITSLESAAPVVSGDSSGMTLFFIGEVEGAGPVVVPHGTTFLQAIAYSGGFTPFAAQGRVQLRRNTIDGPAVVEIDFAAIANGASLSSDLEMRDGDVILVPERRLFE